MTSFSLISNFVLTSRCVGTHAVHQLVTIFPRFKIYYLKILEHNYLYTKCIRKYFFSLI